MFNDLIIYHWLTLLWLREKTQFYIWNELHSIQLSNVNITFFNFMKIANRGNEEKYTIILYVREAGTSYLKMNTYSVGKYFKKSIRRNFPSVRHYTWSGDVAWSSSVATSRYAFCESAAWSTNVYPNQATIFSFHF